MPENTPQSAIQEFIRAVGTPADNQPWDPRSSVLPRDEVRDNRLVTHPITAEELNRLKESLWGDNLIQGFEELTEFNQVQRELLRLKQELSGASPEQRQIAEYRISYLQTNLRMILGNRTNLQLQAGFSKRISELNLKVTIDPTIERNLVAHMQPLTGAIQARVSLAQLGLLFMRKSEGKTVSDEEINQARRQIPRTIQVWNTEQNKEETVTLNPDAWQSAGMLQDPAFASAVLGLENQIDRLLTYDESVPGVSTEALGLNPVDVYYVEYLSVVREKISERRKAIRLETGSQATAEDEKLKKLEDDIITELSQFVWRNQRQQIGTLDDVSRSFFDTTYAPQGNEGDPPIFTQKQIESVATIDRVNFGRQVEAIRERFHDRAVQVMGGANSDGDPVKGLFDQSIFDLGDWKLYSEDVYKDHGRFKIVYPVLEAAAHVGVAPEVIRKYLNPLEMNATFSDKVEDVMVHVRRAWKLPDVITVDGETVPFDVREPKHWDALSPEQWQEIEASQKSTLDQLNQNKEKFKNSLGNIEWNLQSFQQLYELKNPDQMVDQEPDIATLDSLLSSETTLDELLADPEVLKAAPAKLVACYYYLFFKLQQNADAYAELSHDMQLGFDEISDQGLDAMGHLKDAKDQANNWWIYGLFGALGYVIARKVPVLGKTLRFGEKIGWHAGRGAVNLIRRTPRVTPAQRAIRGSRLANELTKTRDMPGEKALLEMLEKTRAGRWVSNLKFVRNASVANGANKVIKYGSFAVIPAVGLYEAYLTHERVKSANGNAQLQAEYAKEYKTTALETSGYLAAALLSFGPQVVLTAPVYYTGSYNRNRAEVKNGWAREAADWNREFDSTGLMGQLRKATSLNAVEAGGGGTLYPRIAFPSRAGQKEAVETIEGAQKIARQRIVEAYFTKNLLISPETSDDMAKKIIQWKTSYVGMATNGGYELTSAYIYQEADLYAEMMLRKEEMEKRNENMRIPFADDDGTEGLLDFSKLDPLSASTPDILKQVTRYRNFVRPVEELVLFNALGQISKEQSNSAEQLRETAKAEESIRRLILTKLSHTIYKFDSLIEEKNWPGIDTLVSSGDTYSKNVVRSYIAAKIGKEIDGFVLKALEGDSHVSDYEKMIHTCEGIMQKFDVGFSGENAMYKEAANSFTPDQRAIAGAAKINPLLELVVGTIAEEK